MKPSTLPRLRWRGVGEVRALEIKGAFERMLVEARAIRAGAASVRELVAATAVVHELEESRAAVVEHLAALKMRRGWGASGHGERRGERRATADGGIAAVGVAGAPPPPAMGHGRPAFSGAGRAAVAAGRSRREASAASAGSAPGHPADPAFSGPTSEGISEKLNDKGDIHYAHSEG